MKYIKYTSLTIFALAIIISLNIFRTSFKAYSLPEVEKKDLTEILSKNELSTQDYDILFQQTGLSPEIIREFREDGNGNEKIEKYQESFFEVKDIRGEAMSPFTFEESDQNKVVETSTGGVSPWENIPLEAIKDGYILVTQSTQTLGYRHGHVGIVVDEDKGRILESLEPGTISVTQPLRKWDKYATVMVLKLKDHTDEEIAAAARYAENELMDLKYNLVTFKKDGEIGKTTYCSLLIWQAFMDLGIDLDSDGGLVVTPADIARSPYLEVVYSNGIDLGEKW